MTDSEQLLGLFRDSGALLEGHFRLSSGLHSSRYLQCALVLEDPRRAERLGRELAELISPKVDTVLSPALGGLIIGHEVARALGVKHRFTERDADGQTVLRRGFKVSPGERIAVIEDVITTGLSTKEVIAVAHAAEAEVVAVGSIVDRSGGRAAFSIPSAAQNPLFRPPLRPAPCVIVRPCGPGC